MLHAPACPSRGRSSGTAATHRRTVVRGFRDRRRRHVHSVAPAELPRWHQTGFAVIPDGTGFPVPDTKASHTNSSASAGQPRIGRVVHRNPGTPDPTRLSTHASWTSPVARAPLPAPADHGRDRPSVVSPWRACPRVLHASTGPTGPTGTIRGASKPSATGTPVSSASRTARTARAASSGWLPPSPTGRRPGRSRASQAKLLRADPTSTAATTTRGAIRRPPS